MKLYKNKKYLEEQYLINKKSLQKIANEIGCNSQTVLEYMKKFGIPRRSLSEAQSTESRKSIAKSIWQREGYNENHPCHKTGPESSKYGKPMSEEQKKKISKTRIENGIAKGVNNPNYGRKHTVEECEIISRKAKERWSHPELRKMSSEITKQRYINHPEIGKKISKSKTGYITPNEVKVNISIGLKNHYKNNIAKNKGIPLPEITKQKISKSLKKLYSDPELRKRCGSTGKSNPRWLGGISFGKYCPEFNYSRKEKVRNKYNRRCYLCEKTEKENGFRLDVHHVDYNKMQGCGKRPWRLLPLCKSCNTKMNSNRWYWFSLLYNHWVLNTEINFNFYGVIYA